MSNSGLIFLESSDFVLTKGSKGPILSITIPAFCLVLFYSTACVHCQNIIPIFKKLPGTVGGCQFAMCNVSTNKNVVRLSKDTIAPITYVPFVMIYVQSKPYMIYKGDYDINLIRNFVFEVSNNLQNKQKFSANVVKKNKNTIPNYSIGVPLCGDDNVCYLTLNEGYPK
jgi:hypothetical protein